MPNSISPTKFRNGLRRPAVSSELKRVSWAFSREPILLCCIGDASRAEQDFFGEKPFYHGFRPLPLLKNDKSLTRAGRNALHNVRTLVEAEREHILQTLRETDWVIGGPEGAAYPALKIERQK